jgi:hypothetical protein
MSVIAFASVKGAPGVTTLACLVGAAWPADRAVMVVECDAGGGDLAARFSLASRIGWPSLVAAARRTREDVPIESHLQQIPGGLDVLVGTSQLPSAEVMTEIAPSFLRGEPASGASRDVLVDLGRVSQRDRRAEAWLDLADSVVLCLRGDSASLVQVRDRVLADLSRWSDRFGLAVVGCQDYTRPEMERFTSVPVLVEIPFDSRSAAPVAGRRGGNRRLSRSVLLARTARLASTLAHEVSEIPPTNSACPEIAGNQRPQPEVLR